VSGLGAFRTLIGGGGPGQCRGRVLVPTVSGADTHRIRCWYPPYRVLIPTVSGAGTHRIRCWYLPYQVLVPTISGAGTHHIRCWYPPYQVLVPTVSGAGTHRIRCWYPPYQVLIPTVSGADTCPSHARSQLGTLQPLQRRDWAFCRLRVGRQALWVSAPAPVLRSIFLSDSPYLLMLLNISQLIPVPQRVVMFRGRRCALRLLC